MGPGQRSRYSNPLRTRRLGVRTPVETRDFLFSTPVQTGPPVQCVRQFLPDGKVPWNSADITGE